MGQEFLDDLEADLDAVFFGADDFTEPATYLPAAGGSLALHVLYDDPYSDPEPQAGGGKVQSRAVTATVRESAITGGAKPGDRITVRGITWKVISAEPNGVGVLVLALHK